MQTLSFQPDSSYVDQAFYDWLAAFSDDLRRNPERLEPRGQGTTHAAVEDLLLKESLLLDEQLFEQWLALYAEQCIYWIPADAPASDPRKKITLEFHDRRRLQDRVARLGTGLAYSQVPPSRTVRMLDRPRIWVPSTDQRTWHARCNFVVHEYRAGKTRALAGWYGYAIGERQGRHAILVKQINLLDCDAPQGNNSFFL